MSQPWDVIIVGAGSAGCVLAGRLSADSRLRVMLIEAGPLDSSPLIRLPKGLVKLLSDPEHTWFYATEPDREAGSPRSEILLRGKGLGGTSNVNGIVYHRGQPQDYDDWAKLGLRGWSWADILPCFRAIEHNVLEATEWRGPGGAIPLRIATRLPRLAEAMIEAAGRMGLARKLDPNHPEQLGIGPAAANIDERSERVTAARAFLPAEVRRRPNLQILVGTRVDKVLFDGRRAVGVVASTTGAVREYRAREVVLSAGALESPRLLQLSGIGPAEHLFDIGVTPIVDCPGVGANYRDHYAWFSQWRLRRARDSENRQFRGWRLARNVLRYYTLRSGPMATGSVQLVIFPRLMDRDSRRADAEFVFAPYSIAQRPGIEGEVRMDEAPGCYFNGFPLRGTSRGQVLARSADPADPPVIRPNYLATEYDREITVRLVRFLRTLMSQPALTPYVEAELGESTLAITDDEIVDFMRRRGSSAYHAVGTCAMGVSSDPNSVLDERLRVRGVAGLRVVDCSVMPQQVSANTNGPVMAVAWRAAEMMRTDLHDSNTSADLA
jgi:choline dehydrogenase-like flavoprotein